MRDFSKKENKEKIHTIFFLSIDFVFIIMKQ